MCSLDCIVQALTPILKNLKYKKRVLTWIKDLSDITIVFSVRKSQYSNSTWYYNYGIGINALTSNKITSINGCHILFRIDNIVDGKELTHINVIEVLKLWEKKYGTLEKLRRCALQRALPLETHRSAITYLTSIDLSQVAKTGDGSLS